MVMKKKKVLVIACLSTLLVLAYHTISYIHIQMKQMTQELVPGFRKVEVSQEDGTYDALSSMKVRAEIVRDACQISRLPSFADGLMCLNPFRSTISKTLVSKEDNSLLFTPLPKCGWTSWMLILYQHFNVSGSSFTGWAWEAPYHLVNLQIASLKCFHHSSVYKERILFVRNPYDRLVSGYKNKALAFNGEYVKTYSNPCEWLTLHSKYNDTILSFKTFVSCILNKAKNGSTDLSSRAAGIYLDHHWAPEFHLSLPCSTDYTLIGKYEHFSEDVQAIIAKHHLNASLKHENKSSDSLRHSLDFWYKQLDSQMIAGLQQLYKSDFEVFDYDPTPPLR